MKRRQIMAACVGILGFAAMMLYVPQLKVERIYWAFPGYYDGSELTRKMNRETNPYFSLHITPAGYDWRWSKPEQPYLGDVEYEIDLGRFRLEAATWAVLVLVALVGLRSSSAAAQTS